ncbi:hypothetical protein [Microbacterium sp.]|uniref:hypothetical protein n=1 Tax=Microbacterium sp. TaxID=51671 RepID=UPI0028118A43|nr:hypothetical protein [Microbacterium sp.]
MTPNTEHPIVVRRRRDPGGVGLAERRLHALIEGGGVHRIVAGSFALGDEWRRLTPIQQHFVRVLEVADRSRKPQVFMGAAAAAVLGIDRIGAWPHRVEVRIARTSGGRSSGAVARRALGFDGVDLLEWRGHLVTSPAQTAIDVAAEAHFTAGVIAFDQALWRRRDGGALTTISEIERVLAAQSRRGIGRAAAALDFSTELSDSVRESEARVLIDRMGFPTPELQREFRLTGGRVARADFYFPDFDHIGEFDGTGKYLDPALLRARTPQQVLLEEKDREDELRRVVQAFSRWRTAAHRDPGMLYDILSAAGLPSRLPRPRRGALR